MSISVRYRYLLCGLLLLGASCSEEKMTDDSMVRSPYETVQITAGIPMTRMSTEDIGQFMRFLWDRGDLITLATEKQQLPYVALTSGNSTTFTSAYRSSAQPEDFLQNEEGAVVYARFPYNHNATINMDSLTTPVACGTPFLYAIDTLKQNKLGLHFHHAMSYLRFHVKHDPFPENKLLDIVVTMDVGYSGAILINQGIFDYKSRQILPGLRAPNDYTYCLDIPYSAFMDSVSLFPFFIFNSEKGESLKFELYANSEWYDDDEFYYMESITKDFPEGGFKPGHVYDVYLDYRKTTHNIQLSEVKDFIYSEIGYSAEIVNMDRQRINNEILGAERLNSYNFWDYYGGSDNEYKLTIATYDKITGEKLVLLNDRVCKNGSTYSNEGIRSKVQIDSDDRAIQLTLYPGIKTQNTYMDMGKGAMYEVTIKIESDDKAKHADFVLTQVINVKDDGVNFGYNPNYYFNDWKGIPGDYIVVSGMIDYSYSSFSMVSPLEDHFQQADGYSIFDDFYYILKRNVKYGSLKFEWNELDALPQGVITNNTLLALDHAMVETEEIKTMNYEYQLSNGEICKSSYKVVFINPFMSGTITGVTLKANAIAPQTVQTAPQVIVVDSNVGEAIYQWQNNALALTEKAESEYMVPTPTVTFEWVNDDSYTELVSQLSIFNSQLKLDATSGEIYLENNGFTLIKDLLLKVKATVIFPNLSIVEVLIPVTFSAED